MSILTCLRRSPYGLALPALVLFVVVLGVPLVLMFLSSLNATGLSLDNYARFFAQTASVRILLQTVEMSVVATGLCLLIGYPTAYVIATAPRMLRMLLLVLVVIPYLTSLLVRTYAWIVILGDNGLLNNVLRDLGLISSPLELLYTRGAVYVGMVHIMLPVMVLPLASAMVGIDRSLMSAARSMGARPFAAFWRVYFPLSLPGVRSGGLLVFVLCLGFYITPAALGSLRDTMLSTYIYAQVQSNFDLPRISTAAFVLLGVTALLLACFGLGRSGAHGGREQAPRRWLWSRIGPLRVAAQALRELATARRARRWPSTLYRAGGGEGAARAAGFVFVGLVMLFLLFPGLVVIVMSFSAGDFLSFPPQGLSLRWYEKFFGDPTWTSAAWTSVQIGVMVALVASVVGTMAAFGLDRGPARLRGPSTMLLLAPITMPSIVVAIAAYFGLVKLGLLATVPGIVLVHSAGAIAYVVVIVSASLANFDRRLEMAARSMRAGPIETLRRVTLPLILPGVIAGALFAFLHSFDEVVKTSLISGLSIRTLPLKMWENIRNEIDPTIAAIASLLMLLPVVWMLLLYVAWWRGRAATAGAGHPALQA